MNFIFQNKRLLNVLNVIFLCFTTCFQLIETYNKQILKQITLLMILILKWGGVK